MEQRCHVAAVWLTWLGLPLLAVVVGLRVGVVAALVVLGLGIAAQVAYVRWFPHISQWMGYGSVADTPADSTSMGAQPPRVTLYTANVCPFCPIIRRRLVELQRHSRFDVEEVDVTFRPEIIRAKGLRSVPVLEANGRLLVGNATSAQIAEFLRAAAERQPTG
ncbi:MAG TPA: glutaredoxin family protein [Vicinamibacterales bacterium]|nr:glutaredoxin family protein [Vicinamibacterales bacterium]